MNLIAKMYGCKEKNVRKVIYSFLDSSVVSGWIREMSY